jgi:hypothetical protein
MVTKVTLNLPSDLVEQVKSMAKLENTTVTEIFRRGLLTDVFLSKEENKGGKVLIRRKDGDMVEIFRPR